MSDTTASNPERKPPTRIFQIPPTYTYAGSFVMLLLSLIVPVIVLLAGSNRSTLFSVVVAVITAVLTVVGIVIYTSLVSARLAVSTGGISYFSSGVTIRAPWQRVAGYGTLTSNKRGGLILYQEAEGQISPPKPVNVRLQSGDPRRLISLFPFDRDWQNGEIGQLIRNYAPQALRDLGDINLKEFDQSHPAPALPEPDLSPDESALATHPKITRTDLLIIGSDIILTLWAVVLVFVL